jgi:hypothetical protein
VLTRDDRAHYLVAEGHGMFDKRICMKTKRQVRPDQREKRLLKRAACLSYPEIRIDPKTETNPKEFIRKQLARKHAQHC